MKFIIATFFIILLPFFSAAGPIYVEVTAENPQDHIDVQTSSLGMDVWAFSVRVSTDDVKSPKDLRAYLILRNDRENNLLSTPIKPAQMENRITQFYAAIHSDLLKWARIHLRDSMTIYVIRLESFKKDFEKK